MCLASVALGRSERFPFVIAANRDEFFARPAAPLDWWTAAPGQPPVLSGRDLTAGGTWLALTAAGRAALVTNVREPALLRAGAPSRGALPLDWCLDGETAAAFDARTRPAGYNGFNLLAFDAPAGDAWWLSNRADAPQALREKPGEGAGNGPGGRLDDSPDRGAAGGLHGLSNAALDTPWPKLVALNRRLAAALDAEPGLDALAERLWEALSDREIPPDSALPSTGVTLERERLLAPAFIHIRASDDDLLAEYGTRASTVVIVEAEGRPGGRRRAHVRERSFDRAGAVSRETGFVIDDWPLVPR